MLDDLLGRTELKEQIAELEEELRHVKRERDAESERRREAVAARQQAEERVNRLEDRIADLEGQTTETDDQLDFRRRETLHGQRRKEVCNRLASVTTGPEGALTAVVPNGHELPEPVRSGFGDRTPLVARAAPCIAYVDDAGLVSVAIRPAVLPDDHVEWGKSFTVDETWFRPTGRFAFALVRSDVFALGVYDGDERMSLTGFTTDVMSDHSKGGFSQARFERIRDGQIRDHLDRCRAAVADAEPERLYIAGESTLLGEFEADETAAVDATGDPEEAIDAAFRDFWSARLFAV